MILHWIDKEKHILSLFNKGDNHAMDKLYMEYADYPERHGRHPDAR